MRLQRARPFCHREGVRRAVGQGARRHPNVDRHRPAKTGWPSIAERQCSIPKAPEYWVARSRGPGDDDFFLVAPSIFSRHRPAKTGWPSIAERQCSIPKAPEYWVARSSGPGDDDFFLVAPSIFSRHRPAKTGWPSVAERQRSIPKALEYWVARSRGPGDDGHAVLRRHSTAFTPLTTNCYRRPRPGLFCVEMEIATNQTKE
jgi:hypothetical protein